MGDHRCLSILLLLVVALVYANSFPGAFLFDDLVVVRDNPLVQHPDLKTIFRSDYWGIHANSGLYRPLTILSLAGDRWFLGSAPLGFHLVNVLLHGAITLLLFQMLRIWGVALAAAVIAALLFAVHPLHHEVVDVVVGRSELLVALFLLLAFLLARRKDPWSTFSVCLCYLLALLSKEHAITFLVLLPLWEAYFAGTWQVWKERRVLYAALFAVAALWLLWAQFGVVRMMPSYPLAEAASPLAFVDGTTRVLTALHHQWLYLFKLLAPHGLQAVYSVADMPPFIRSLFSFPALLVLLASAGALLLLAWGWRRRSLLALFGVLYLLAFLPTSNLFFAIGVTMAERLTYFPSLWFCAGMGVLLAMVIDRPAWHHYGWAAVLCYSLFLGGLTVWRNTLYDSEVRLWSYEVVQNPQDFLGWQNLGDSLLSIGNIEDADQSYRWMLTLAPDYPAGLRGRTAFFLRQGRYDEALPTAHKVFELSRRDNDTIGMGFDGQDLAEAYRGIGKCAEALAYLDGPSRIVRDQLSYSRLRGETLACLGRDDEAVEELSRISEELLSPNIRQLLAASHYRLGRFSEARRHLETALTTGGADNVAIWGLLGRVYLELGQRRLAQEAFTAALRLAPENEQYRAQLLQAQQPESAQGNR